VVLVVKSNNIDGNVFSYPLADALVPTALKKSEIQDTFKWLWDNRHYYSSTDKAQKELFFERLEWLKVNGWWHYRILRKNLTYYSTYVVDDCGFVLRGRRLREYLQVQATKLPCNMGKGNPIQKPTEKEETMMPYTKSGSGWTDEPNTEQVRDCGYGNYIRIVVRSNGKSRGLVIENGQYGRLPDGNKDTTKLLSRNRIFVSLYNGNVKWLAEEMLKVCQQQTQTTITD